MLASQGHNILLHGRNPEKLEKVKSELSMLADSGSVEGYVADFSVITNVVALAQSVSEHHDALDVLINNAGIFKTPNAVTPDGLDVRFAVNTIAPYLLTQRLLPLLGSSGRVINLSSAAQSPVNLDALIGKQSELADMDAYAQSKLAITMWSHNMALSLGDTAPALIAINPGSMLGSKMVQEGFGVAGNDIRIGAEILVRAALDNEFSDASGKYFDNDKGQFASPHPDALNPKKCEEVIFRIENILERFISI